MKRVAINLAWTSIGFVAGVAATLITLALLLSREEPKLTPTPNREHRPEIIQKKLKSISATDCNPVGHSKLFFATAGSRVIASGDGKRNWHYLWHFVELLRFFSIPFQDDETESAVSYS